MERKPATKSFANAAKLLLRWGEKRQAQQHEDVQRPDLPPFIRSQVLGPNLLRAYIDTAVRRRQKESQKTLPTNDPSVHLQNLFGRLTKEHRHLSENERFSAVVDGIRKDLISNYNATFLLRSPDPDHKRPDLYLVCAQLDHHLPIDPTGVSTIEHATWFDYIRDQATAPYAYRSGAENVVPSVPQALTQALGHQASKAS